MIGKKVKRLRGGKGWSQARLSQKSGVSRVTIARVEVGMTNPDLLTRKKLAKALGVGILELLD